MPILVVGAPGGGAAITVNSAASGIGGQLIPNRRIKRRVCLFASLGLVAAIQSRSLASSVLLDLAEVAALHGRTLRSTFVKAITLEPRNEQKRMQAGRALAEAGDFHTAIDILLPLVNASSPPAPGMGLLISLLFAGGYANEAFDIFDKLQPHPPVTPNVAAKLIQRYLAQDMSSWPNVRSELLSTVLGIDLTTVAALPLYNQLTRPDLWSTLLGKKLADALGWRAKQPPASAIADRPPAPSLYEIGMLLGVSTAGATLGTNLLTNGNLTKYDFVEDRYVGWAPSYMCTGDPWNLGVFVLGPDGQTSAPVYRSLRVDALQVNHLPSLQPARAGFAHSPIPLNEDVPYVLSFAYRTEQTDNSAAAIWVSDTARVFFAGDHSLSATHGTWKQVTIIAWNRSGAPASIAPLLRSFGVGSVWFKDISLYSLGGIARLHLAPRDAIIDVR